MMIPTKIQSTNIAHKKNATKAKNESFKANENKILEKASQAPKSTRNAGSSRAH